MNFLKIDKLFKSKTTIILVFSIISFFLFSDVSFAAEDIATKWINQTIDLLQGVVALLASLLWIITSFVSIFLHPSWVNWSIFWLDTQFKTIWILISNVVYFIFALILVAVAFMNIIWQWKENYELKQALPKLVVWVLIVPISWFFIQFILSISSILTVSVLSLPFDTFDEEPFFKNMTLGNTWAICTDYTINLWGSWVVLTGTTIPWTSSWLLVCNVPFISVDEYIHWWGSNPWLKNSVFWIITIYTYWVMWLNHIDKIWEKMWSISTIADLLVNKVIFDLIFFVIYFLLMIALFLALFTRWVWIWIYTMFSPVFGLLYFLWKAKEWVWDEKFGILWFIKLAMVPVLVAAALSFWLVFLFVVWNSIQNDNKPVFCWGTKENCIDFAWIKLTIGWVDQKDDSVNQLWIWWFLWNTIMKIIWLVVLWMSIMAALKSSEITNAVAKPIMEFWESVWSLAKGWLKYLPIMPAPWSGMMSAEALKTAWSTIASIPSSSAQSRWSDIAKFFSSNPDKIEVGQKLTWLTKDLKSMWVWQEGSKVNKSFSTLLPELKWEVSNLNSDEFKTYLNSLPDVLKAKMINDTFKVEKTKDWKDKYTIKNDFSNDNDFARTIMELNNTDENNNWFLWWKVTSSEKVIEIIKSRAKDTKTSEAEVDWTKTKADANATTPLANKVWDTGVSYQTVNNNNNVINVQNSSWLTKELNLEGIEWDSDKGFNRLSNPLSEIFSKLNEQQRIDILRAILKSANIKEEKVNIRDIAKKDYSNSPTQ